MKKILSLMLCIMLLLGAATGLAEACTYDVGDIVTLGHYEQDNDVSNGPEEIEWIVLDVQDGKALLLSKYGLDCKPYNEEYVDITWENCSLRAWLNNDFLNAAFTAEEQVQILLTDVDNGANQGYSEWSTNGGFDTQDRVILLSYAEANRYLGVTFDNKSNIKARVSSTAYAKANGVWVSDHNKTENGIYAGWWWLRSSGPDLGHAAFVYSDGSLSEDCVHGLDCCVRPAVWVNLESFNL